MKRFCVFAICLFALSATAEAKQSRWEKISEGPSLEVAEARCNLMALQSSQGFYASGSTAQVVGVAIASGIANAIHGSIVKSNCMATQGWKKVKVAAGSKPAKIRQAPQVADLAPAEEAPAKKKPLTAPPMRIVIE